MLARKFISLILQGLVVLLITTVLLEISLRLFPGLIPAFLLVDFNPAARERIAARRGFPTDATVRFLPRTDGGPPRKMRVFRPWARVTLEVPDDGFVRTVIMDEEGFCNPTGGASAAPLQRGMLALGDSFTWCTGVDPDEAWPALLAPRIGASGVNLGSPGIGLYEHLELLRQFGLRRAPRLVILNLYEGNDLRDAQSFAEYRRAVGDGAESKARRVLKDRPLGRHSHAYNLIVVGVRQLHRGLRQALYQRAGIPTGEEPEADFRYTLRLPEGEAAFNTGNVDQDEVRAARAMQSGDLDPAILAPGLEEFVKLAKRHGFAPVVAYTPSAHTAYAGVVAFRDPELDALMPYFSGRQREYLARKAEELCFAYVDLTPAFQRAARQTGSAGLLYFPGVLHLTPRGHAVAADALAEALRGLASGDTMPPGSEQSAFPPASGEDRP